MESRKTFRTAMFDDGTYAVLRWDPGQPHLLEVVAIFYDAARAQRYAEMENGQPADAPAEHQAPPPADPAPSAEDEITEMNGVEIKLTGRQSAVLDALRKKAGEDSVVEIKAADLAEAAHIPLGSVHSVIQSLEKKKFILIARPGSPQVPAAYQVL